MGQGKSKPDASYHLSLEMGKTLLKQHLTMVYITTYHVTYMLKINKLKQNQNQNKSLEESFIKLDGKPQILELALSFLS